MSGWKTTARKKRVGDFLELRVSRMSGGVWCAGVELFDPFNRHGLCAELDSKAFDRARFGHDLEQRDAERLAESAAKALGDVRAWMALFRYCGRFAGHIRMRPRRRARLPYRQPLLLGAGT